MKDNQAAQSQEIVSSGALRLAMRPTLRQMMAMRIINDNRDLDNAAMKQLGLMAACAVVMLTVVLTS